MESEEDDPKLLSIQCLPLSSGRKSELSTTLQTFHITFESIYGLKQSSATDDYHLQAILFDQKYGTFLGNCWIGKPVQNEISQAVFNQNIYFYTGIPVEDLLLVIELITPSEVPKCLKSCGWAGLSLKNDKEEEDCRKKMPLVRGSPISLIPCERISKKSGKKKKKTNSVPLLKATSMELSFSQAPFPSLLDISHLVPENILFDATTQVPGLMPASISVTKNASQPLKLQLQQCITFVLERLCIRMSSACEDIDKDIVERFQLHQESEIKINDLKTPKLPVTLPPKGKVAQRRLQVAVHNGYCFIQDPDMYHLHVESPVTPTISKSLRRASSMGTLSGFKEESLVVRSDIKLSDIPDDSNIFIVFLLEYVISLPDTTEDKQHIPSSLNKGQTANISVVWGFCHLGSLRENPSQNISLTSDPSQSPHKLFFLKTEQEFEMTFSAFSLLKQRTASSHYADPTSDIYSSGRSETSTKTSYFRPFSHSTPKHKSLADIPMSLHNQGHPKKSQTTIQKADCENNFILQEVTLVPSSLPVVPPLLHSNSVEPGESFNVFTKFYWDQLQPVVDHHGKTATVIDTAVPYKVNVNLELHAPPQKNEYMMQFLALSGFSEYTEVPCELFFTFQFYRFLPIRSESLFLKPLSGNEENPKSSLVYALHKNQEKNPVLGFQVTYIIDPSELNNGEYKPFLQYLMKQTIHIDLWVGQSLLYFGTVALPLKYLCRQGREAIVSNLELDILNCEYPDESIIQGNLPEKTPIGKLHLRLASIRHPLPTKTLEKLENLGLDEVFNSVIIQPATEENCKDIPAPTVCKARRIVQTNKELTKLLSIRSRESNMSPDPEVAEERRRKLARMEAVRNIENNENTGRGDGDGFHDFFRERQKDLQNIESYIKKNKTEIIQSFLQSSVTTKKKIFPTVGTKTFFEFVIQNPFQVPKKVEIIWKCPDLHLVADLKMWQSLRSIHNISQPMEALELCGSNPHTPILLLQPQEKVNVPFTYDCLCTQTSALNLFKAVSGHHFSAEILSSVSAFNSMECCAKVQFVTEDQTLLAILDLKVHPLPPSFTHIFKFLSMENSMFKNSIQVSRENTTKHKFSAKCSNPEVAFSVQEGQDMDSGANLHLKAPTKSSGKSTDFYVFIYKDQFQAVPFQTWSVSVCSLQRIDLSCVAGQLMRSSLLIRGTCATNLMKCSASSKDLQLHPSEPFVLSPFAIQELSMNIRLLVPGIKFFQIAMVNHSLEQVVQSWLLVLSCQKPTVSKAFQIHLTLGKETAKRITYTNPYHQERQLVLYSSHPQLLQLREYQFLVGPAESYCIGLYFVPQEFIFTETIFLYLNDATSDKNEETFCIKIVCQ